MVDINCLVCEEPIKIPSYIDPDDYDGQLYCQSCQLLLDIKLLKSKVRKYRFAAKQTKPRPSEINIISNIPRPDYSKKAEGAAKELKEN